MESINTLVLHRVVENNIENFEDISVKTFELILAKHPKSFLSIDNAFNNDCPISNPICLTFDDGFSSDVDVVLPMLKSNNAIATFFIVCDYLNKDGYMTNDQVVQLSNNNMQIGSHSLTHPNFVDLPLRFKKDELRSSKIFLEDLLSKEVTTFSFPFGFVDNESIDEVFRAGYKFCCTSNHGLANLNSNLIPRNSINSQSSIVQIYKIMKPSIITRTIWSVEDMVKPNIKYYLPSLYPKIRDLLSKL